MVTCMRFIPISDPTERYLPNDYGCWWWDTARLLKNDPDGQLYIAIEVRLEDDPNNFVRVDKLFLLFTDPAEYYFVCDSCSWANSDKQWSGSTHGSADWFARARKALEQHQQEKSWCEFCDPVFGNGGWT